LSEEPRGESYTLYPVRLLAKEYAMKGPEKRHPLGVITADFEAV